MLRASFRARLEKEFLRRRRRNARYSLRAFAALLATDHSTLSQIMRGLRPVPPGRLRAWGRTLGLGREETAAYTVAEQLPSGFDAARLEQMRVWLAEAAHFLEGPTHWKLARLVQGAGFRPDSRWIAARIHASVDEVNMALSRLLRLRLLEVQADGAWRCARDAANLDEREFREVALARVRSMPGGENRRAPWAIP